MKYLSLVVFCTFALAMISCNKTKTTDNLTPEEQKVKALTEKFAPVKITADMSHLTEREKQLVEVLVDAAKLSDIIFWKQTSFDGIAVRDSLKKLNTPGAKVMLDYVNINYGPYDVMNEQVRFVGKGSAERFPGGAYYPVDMTKKEFEDHIKANPADKDAFESQYTVIVRENGKLKAVPYHEYYPEIKQLADKLDKAAELADNVTLKAYLKARAEAFRTDDYYTSDLAWMDIKDSNIDIVIGPIENYDDAMFNYKTAYEAVVMIKDFEASKELDMFKAHIQDFQSRLPIDKKFITPVKTENEILQIVNVAYFAGDCQSGTKTIAAALPNDPKVIEVKGGKKSMYKNMMEAKFEKSVKPIGDIILAPAHRQYVDKKAFTSFVTLHECSHTLGRGFVFGSNDLTIRKALKERYSTIEETKADILSMLNHKHLVDMGLYKKDDINKAIATYIAGLYRSLRFGMNEAHGQANLIQLNFLRATGGIKQNSDGTYTYDENTFFAKVSELATLVLNCEVLGNYEEAGKIMEKYGKPNAEITKTVEKLKNIPSDINTTYAW